MVFWGPCKVKGIGTASFFQITVIPNTASAVKAYLHRKTYTWEHDQSWIGLVKACT